MSRFTLTTFTPGEAERITGLSTMMQRDWRRRGFIESTEGHARFDAFALAELMVLKMLADAGVGPQDGVEIAKFCAAGVMWHSLQWVDAYEGDYQRALEWNNAAVGPSDWAVKSNWLARSVMRQKRLNFAPARFFIRWADGTERWDQSLDSAFNAYTSDAPQVAGPCIVLDQNALGGQLLERARRAFVHVDLSDLDAAEPQP